MNPFRPQPDDVERLLDAHLDRLEADEQDALVRRLQGDAALKACSDRLGAMLEPLDAWSPVPPPINLVQNTLARLPKSRAPASTSGRAPALVEPTRLRRPWVTLREVLAVAACIALFSGVVLPSIKKLRFGARQTACANNLQAIYAGTMGYATIFGGQLPFAGQVASAPGFGTGRLAVQPVSTAGQVSNSSHQYLLVRLRLVSNPAAFICPSRPTDHAMDPHAVSNGTTFPSATNCSYDLQLMREPAALDAGDPRQPWQSDANPFFDTPALTAMDSALINSRSHDQRGQNVLRLGGDVRFEVTPVIGNDNIWLAGDGWQADVGGDDSAAAGTFPRSHDAYLVPGVLRVPWSNETASRQAD